jgi:uncharacterized protein (TIGR03437 family)
MVTTRSLIVACLMALPALAQSSGPFLPGAIYVVHSATRRTAQTPETGLAPGSLCDIDITGLYPPSGTLSPDDKVTLRFRPPGATDAGDLGIVAGQASFGNLPTHFTALIPSDTPIGQAELLAVTANGKSFSTMVWIAASDFGVFTKAGAGYDAAVAQVWRDTPTLVSLTRPAQAGDWVTLWGTGLGSAASTVLVNVAGIGVPPRMPVPRPDFPAGTRSTFGSPREFPTIVISRWPSSGTVAWGISRASRPVADREPAITAWACRRMRSPCWTWACRCLSARVGCTAM